VRVVHDAPGRDRATEPGGAEADAAGDPVPDCQDCGACCFADNPGHVPVTGDDFERLGPEEQTILTRFEANRCFMRTAGGRCINLVQEGARFGCAIYLRRPAVCRDYERGGAACSVDRERLIRRLAGENPSPG